MSFERRMIMDHRQKNGCDSAGEIDSEGFTVSKVRLFGKTIMLMTQAAGDELQSTCKSTLKEGSFRDPADDSQACSLFSSCLHQNSPILLPQEKLSSSDSNHEANKLSDKRPFLALAQETPKTTNSKEAAGKLQKRKKQFNKATSGHKQEQPYSDEKTVPCPRCGSLDTKFCYYNNYNLNQPRHFCKDCHRYWTAGGVLRHVPLGAGRRKTKQSNLMTSTITITTEAALTPLDLPPSSFHHRRIGSPTGANINFALDLQPKLTLALDQDYFGRRAPESKEKISDGSMEASPTSPLMAYDERWCIELQNSSPESSRSALKMCGYV